MIAEGFRLMPRLVKPLLAVGSQAVWLLPTPEFRQAVFNSRGGAQWGFIGRTSDPERALCNLLKRDQMFTRSLHEEAKRLRLNTIGVNTKMTADEMAGRVTEAFGLSVTRLRRRECEEKAGVGPVLRFGALDIGRRHES